MSLNAVLDVLVAVACIEAGKNRVLLAGHLQLANSECSYQSPDHLGVPVFETVRAHTDKMQQLVEYHDCKMIYNYEDEEGSSTGIADAMPKVSGMECL